MIKIRRHIFLSFFYGVLVLSIVIGALNASEDDFFEQKDKDFWVLKDKRAFTEAAKILIDDEGNWKGNPPVPQYIKFSQKLTKDDLPILEKWLSLKELECFSVADKKEHPNLELINSWYSDLREQSVDIEKRNFYKLAWLNFESTFYEVERGEDSILPQEWVETNRLYQLKNTHFNSEIFSY